MITQYWSRTPGKFVNKKNGNLKKSSPFTFSGTMREWYELLVESIIDATIFTFSSKERQRIFNKGPMEIRIDPNMKPLLKCSMRFSSNGILNCNNMSPGSWRFIVNADPNVGAGTLIIGNKIEIKIIK